MHLYDRHNYKYGIIRRVTRPVCVLILCLALILPGSSFVFASVPVVPFTQLDVATTVSASQLDALVAPIALYPDNLLAQVLVASTYPLELVQLHQWLQKNPELAKDITKLNEAVAKQPWDPSVQSMASLPDVVKWLVEDVQWTSDLGNAFLAQQKEVMDAVQRMRSKAKDKGALVSNDKMKVETQVIESKSVIVIEPSNPEIIYVPSYNPQYVYGNIGYPYPPIYYPPYYGAYWAAGAIGFGFGLMVGAAWGGWGWGCGWGRGDINIDHHNNFNRNNNFNRGDRNRVDHHGNRGNRGDGGLGNRGDRGGRNQVNPLGGDRGGKWKHDSSRRSGSSAGDRARGDRASSRGNSLANRQKAARSDIGRRGGNLASARSGNRGSSSRGSAPGVSNRAASFGDRGGSSPGMGNRGSGLGSGNRSSSLGSSRGSSGSNRSVGGSGSRMGSSRGSSSMSGSRGSFGGSRGGGGGFSRGGGGMRGGGGGRGGRR